jgi:hypothetical protein
VDPTCEFCNENETNDHLFFGCVVAKVIWGIIAQSLGANNIPLNIKQYWEWVKIWLPGGGHVYTFGLAAICWAIWKARNRTHLENKNIKHPGEILCHACAFMKFWTGLYKVGFPRAAGGGCWCDSGCGALGAGDPEGEQP